jgi:hypothetical protein
MNDSPAMSKSQRLDEMGNGKRTMIIAIAVLVVAALIAVLAMGFRGRHIGRNAAALTTPVATPVGVPTQPVTPRP